MVDYLIGEKGQMGLKKSRHWLGCSLLSGVMMALVWIITLQSNASATAKPAPDPMPPTILTYCYQGQIKAPRLVVVDKYRQRVLVFRYQGELVQDYEFPCATGSNPGTKVKEGDERTPVGIYFTTHRYKDNKVTIFGDRAIHLNYPSPFDKYAGRQGNGIYFHGTNQELKPTSTNGCIVLGNGDMAKLSNLIQDQRTPVVVVENFKLAGLNARKTACNYLFNIVEKESPADKTASQGFRLAFRQNGVKVTPKMHELAGKLLSKKKPNLASRLKVRSNGYLLLGIMDQWVLVTDNDIYSGRRTKFDSSRRHYLLGKNPVEATLLSDHLVLPTLKSAMRLARLAPKPVVSKPAAPKTVASKPAEPQPPKVDQAKLNQDKLQKMFSAWLRAWNTKNLRRYISHYAREFKSDGLSRNGWRRKKAYLNKVYKIIQVKADKVDIKLNGQRAKVNFLQHYRSDWHRDVGMKELDLVLRRGRWLIVKETWQPIEPKADAPSKPVKEASS
jgi:murein L,D-transpeptidase YafK